MPHLARLELPTEWFDNPIDGKRNQQFWLGFLQVLLDKGWRVELGRVLYGADRASRIALTGEIYCSYHCYTDRDRNVDPFVLHLKEAPIVPYYSIDGLGYAGFSEVARKPQYFDELARAIPLEEAETCLANQRERFLILNESKYTQPAAREEGLPDQPFVFLALQVQSDTVAQLSEIEGTTLIEWCVALAQAHRRKLVIKRHPWCGSQLIADKLEQLAGPDVAVSSASIHTLISRASAVVTINSGVGFEALIHGKPVYCCGQSEWMAAAAFFSAKDELSKAFTVPQPAQAQFSKQFCAMLLSQYWCLGDDKQSIARCFDDYCNRNGIAPDALQHGAADPTAVNRRLQTEIIKVSSELELARKQKLDLEHRHSSSLGKLAAAEQRAQAAEQRAQAAEQRAQAAEQRAQAAEQRAQAAEEQTHRARMAERTLLQQLLHNYSSLSWRSTRPLRLALNCLKRVRRFAKHAKIFSDSKYDYTKNSTGDREHAFTGSVRVLQGVGCVHQDFDLEILVSNLSTNIWRSTGDQPIFASYHWHDAENNLIILDGLRSPLCGGELAAGEQAVTRLHVRIPPLRAHYELVVTLVQEGVIWFEESSHFSADRLRIEII